MNALFYFLVWAVIILVMMRFGCGAHVDPVCGKTVRPSAAKPSVHDGSVYYFCSRDCREIFEAAPEQYLEPRAETLQPQLENRHV